METLALHVIVQWMSQFLFTLYLIEISREFKIFKKKTLYLGETSVGKSIRIFGEVMLVEGKSE